ncbi:hypothetical protein V8B97DRAFT_1497267 [Scleroderma yunnanense]
MAIGGAVRILVLLILKWFLGPRGYRSLIMLTSFIRRNGKKKGTKQTRIWQPPRCRRPPTSPESFESPEILDINERSIYTPPGQVGATSSKTHFQGVCAYPYERRGH